MNTYTNALRTNTRKRYDRIGLVSPWAKVEFDGMLDLSSSARIATKPSSVFALSLDPEPSNEFWDNHSHIVLSQLNK